MENASTPGKTAEQKTVQKFLMEIWPASYIGTYSDNVFAHLVSFPKIKISIRLHTYLTYASHDSRYMHAQNVRTF